MFANPEIQKFIAQLIGGATPGEHLQPPSASGYRGALAQSLLSGLVHPLEGAEFRAPGIIERGGGHEVVPQGNPARSAGSQQVTPESSFGVHGGAGNAQVLATGLTDLGKGLSNAFTNYEARKQLAAQAQALAGRPLNTAATPQSQPSPTFTQPGVAQGQGTGDYFSHLRAIENPRGDPNAVSTTGATGQFQFLPSTFKQYALPGESITGDQTAVVQRFTAANNEALTKALGRPPTAGELYLAHQQGAPGAAALLGNPDKTPRELGLANAVQVNNGDPDAPASQYVNKWLPRFEGVPSPFAAPKAPKDDEESMNSHPAAHYAEWTGMHGIDPSAPDAFAKFAEIAARNGMPMNQDGGQNGSFA